MSKKRKKRKQNVRNAGVSSAKDAGRPASRSLGEGGMPADRETDTSPAQQVLEREREIRRAAYELYLEEGGGELDALLENGQYTRGAFQSQMTAARDGGEGWGPPVTPYEDRMTRSLQRKLILERREWIERCRERIEAGVEEIEAQQREADKAGESPLPAAYSEQMREIVARHLSGDTQETAPEIEINAGEQVPEPVGVT